jgi:hypothetical protein
MNLAEYIKAQEIDDNTFWRMSSGEHQNLLDEAIELLAGKKMPEPLYRMHDMPKETLTIGKSTTEIAIAYQHGAQKEIVIQLSCGNQLHVPIEIKDDDIPCPCGNPNHWLVKHYPAEVTK